MHIHAAITATLRLLLLLLMLLMPLLCTQFFAYASKLRSA
jgi:hypothetical protein